jgi:hypothetical protein
MMQIEEGKFYKDRDGEKVGPMGVRPNYEGPYKWWDEFCLSYRGDGCFCDEPHDADLIEEWKEPTALPLATEADEGWGLWNGGTVLYESQTHMFDYREECINGVWRWQSRPRKPVVKKLERVIATPTKSYRVSVNEIDGVIDCSSVKMEPY